MDTHFDKSKRKRRNSTAQQSTHTPQIIIQSQEYMHIIAEREITDIFNIQKQSFVDVKFTVSFF